MATFAIPWQVPYRQARDGFWGDQTSTLNWCEEDYNITHYCAETINTLSNLIFLWLGVKGIRNCLAYGHSPILALTFVGYIIIGIGSMAFHSTLKYSMQLADELPMIYTTCIMGFATFTYSRSRTFSFWVGSGLTSLATFITVYYHITKNPDFHQNAFTVLVLSVVGRGVYVTKYVLQPELSKRSPSQADRIMGEMWSLMKLGVVYFLVGYGIWGLDIYYCHHLISWRRQILLPWSIVLEGHGWWHLFTGLGAYFLITWRVWLNCCLDGNEDKFELKWPSLFAVPEVVPRSDRSNGWHRKTQ